MSDDIKDAKLSDLKPDLHNANKHTERGTYMLNQSVGKFGSREAGTVDRNGRIVGGNNRHTAYGDLGLEDVQIIKADPNKPVFLQYDDLDLTDPDNPARELSVALNRSAQVGIEFDPETLAEYQLAEVDLGDWFKDDELSELLADIDTGNDGNDAEPEITQIEAEKYHEKWQVKPGNIWQIGDHIIACLDCLKEENIKRLTNKVDFVFADPPYGIDIVAANGYVGGGEAYDIPFGGVKKRGDMGGSTAHIRKTGMTYIESNKLKGFGSSNKSKPFGKEKPIAGSDGSSNIVDVGKYYPVIGDDTTETAKSAASLLLKLYPDACHIWWGGNYYTDILSPSSCWVIWDKDNTGNFADCEMAWTNQQKAARIFKHRWNGMLKASEQGQRRIHPTQKPIALAEYCFEKYGNDGDVIIDPFLGSGISILAAEKIGNRRVVGYELEPVYISVTLERWEQATGKTAELIG